MARRAKQYIDISKSTKAVGAKVFLSIPGIESAKADEKDQLFDLTPSDMIEIGATFEQNYPTRKSGRIYKIEYDNKDVLAVYGPVKKSKQFVGHVRRQSTPNENAIYIIDIRDSAEKLHSLPLGRYKIARQNPITKKYKLIDEGERVTAHYFKPHKSKMSKITSDVIEATFRKMDVT